MPSFTHWVVYRGRIPGVYDNWPETELQIKGFKGNKQRGHYSYDEAKTSLKAYQKNPAGEFLRAPNPQTMKGPLVLTDSEGSAPPSPAKERRTATTQGPIPLTAPVKRARSTSKEPPAASSGQGRICGEKK